MAALASTPWAAEVSPTTAMVALGSGALVVKVQEGEPAAAWKPLAAALTPGWPVLAWSPQAVITPGRNRVAKAATEWMRSVAPATLASAAMAWSHKGAATTAEA